MKKDLEIWENFKSGDKAALSYVYFQNFDFMYQYGMKFKKDPDFVKDCIQDVFYKLIDAGSSLGTTNNIRYYLFKALKNHIMRELSNEKRANRLKEDSEMFQAIFFIEEQAVEKTQLPDKEKALVKALGELSDRQREIIYLKYECGMNYEEICSIMNIKNDSARKLVFRAIRSLRDIINIQLKSVILYFISIPRRCVF